MWYSLSGREKAGLASLVAAFIGVTGYVGYQQLSAPASRFLGGVASGSQPLTFAVQVAGAVAKPGVISATQGLVVQEAIEMSGGLTPDADTSRINLAARLIANSRLYVPTRDESVGETTLGPYSVAATQSIQPLASSGSPRIRLNAATENELDQLPGVGPKTARAIIDFRSSIGGFTSVDQLIDVKGIGPKKLEQIRPFVSL
jgi:competence protein ComEA